jgi:hypothetical protein
MKPLNHTRYEMIIKGNLIACIIFMSFGPDMPGFNIDELWIPLPDDVLLRNGIKFCCLTSSGQKVALKLR